jgi:hypothetical protein
MIIKDHVFMILKDRISMTVQICGRVLRKLGPGLDGDKDNLCEFNHSHRREMFGCESEEAYRD